MFFAICRHPVCQIFFYYQSRVPPTRLDEVPSGAISGFGGFTKGASGYVRLSIPLRSSKPNSSTVPVLSSGLQSNMQGAAPVESQDQTLHPRVRVLQSENCAGINASYGEWREPFQPLIRCPTDYGPGPGDTFGKIMADAAGDNVTIGLVGVAYDGAKIEYFLQDCASFNAWLPAARRHLH